MSHYEHDLREGEPPPLPPEPARHFPTHPLFPLPEGVRETKEIHEITFDRWSDKGVKERCPDRFGAAELTSLAQVVDMFGGGTYQFIAFDSRGNFSRWTPEKEKVRIDLPSKPFRHVERADSPAQEAQPQQALRHAAPPADMVGVLMQQSIAAQERADRLMAALIDRLATPPPVPPPPQADPIAMLSGLATVLEKIRPAQAGDMVGQLSGLVTIVKQLKGSQGSESSSSDEVALQPFLSMVTNAMLQKPGGAQAPAANPPPQQASPQPPDLVWVLLPDVGPVLMRHEQAARMMSRPSAAALPAPAASSATVPPAPEVNSRPVANPAPPAPVAAPPPPATVAALPAPAPVAGPAPPAPVPAPSPPAPEQTPPAVAVAPAHATPSAPPAAAAPPTSAPAAPAQRCFVCGEPGRIDPAQPTVLVCRSAHRSLIGPGVAPPASPRPVMTAAPSLLPLDGGNITVSPADLDAMLADPDVLQALSPDIRSALAQVRAQMGRP